MRNGADKTTTIRLVQAHIDAGGERCAHRACLLTSASR
jgi:hypothetical protein